MRHEIILVIDSQKSDSEVLLRNIIKLLQENNAKVVVSLCYTNVYQDEPLAPLPPSSLPADIVPDDYEMPFGKYKGQEIGNVPAEYLDWLHDQPWVAKWRTALAYIEQNRERLDRELD